MRCYLLVLITLFSFAAFAKGAAPTSAYRVLHASPQEIASALFSPLPAMSQRAAAARSGQSRLSKYFRIKSKTVRNNQVVLELLPIIPQVEDYLPSTKPIKISVLQTSSLGANYNFDSKIEILDGVFLKALIQLSPHESGSLLKLQLRETNLSQNLLNAFLFTSTQLGFIAESAETAIKKDQAEKK